MSQNISKIVILAIALCLGGCTTFSVTKVDSKNISSATGFTYSLPKPCLQITPNTDGTVSVSVVYLPDLDNTYAIKTGSFLSLSTASFSKQGGLLTQVNFNSDNTGTPSNLAQTSSALATALLQSSASQSSTGTGSGSGTAGSQGAAAANSSGAANAAPAQGGPASSATPAIPTTNPTTLVFKTGYRLGPALVAIDEDGKHSLRLTPIKLGPCSSRINSSGQAVWKTHIAYPLQAPVIFPPEGEVKFAPDLKQPDTFNLTLTASSNLVAAEIVSATDAEGKPVNAALVLMDPTHLLLTVSNIKSPPQQYTFKLGLGYLDSLGQGQRKDIQLTATLP